MTTSFVPNNYSEPQEEVTDAKPLTRKDVAIGVFIGLWAYSLTAGTIYEILRFLTIRY